MKLYALSTSINMDTISYSPATGKDLYIIQELLAESHLPFEDIDGHLENFIVAKKLDRVIGCIGLESLGQYGLLRSLSVSPVFRNLGIAAELYKRLIAHAAGLQVKEIYLLTTGAEDYFKKQGFIKLDRREVPGPLVKTREFSGLCPSSAICMFKKLHG